MLHIKKKKVALVVRKNPPPNVGHVRDMGSIPGLGRRFQPPEAYPLEEGMATPSSVLAWRIPMDRGAWQTTVRGVAKSQTRRKKLSMHTQEESRLRRYS